MTYKLIHFLFSFFPREMFKYRKKVYSFRQMVRYIEIANGLEDVYVSLYDDSFIIDKLWFEIDAPSIEDAIEEAKKIKKHLNDLSLPHIIVFSGSKGFHFYIPVKFYKPPNKDVGNAILKHVIKSITKGFKYIDRISQSEQLVRVPNTINLKSGKYCTFVSLDNLRIEDVSRPNEPNDFIIKPIDIRELYDIDVIDYQTYDKEEEHELKIFNTSRTIQIPDGDIYKFLSFFIRPCLLEELKENRNPSHNTRTDFVSELMYVGFKEEEVVEIIRRLKWRDFNEDLTRYHVRKIYEKKLKPFSRIKLEEELGRRCR